MQTALGAARLCGRADTVLVWHLGLLKLSPLVDPAGASTVAFVHGIEAWKPLDRITAGILSRTAAILTNSDYTWQRFIRENPGYQYHPHLTVPLGIGAESSEPRVAPDTAQPVAVMVGRLDASEGYKGHREVIEAWRSVRAAVPGAVLKIIGDGSLAGELLQLVSDRGLNGQVVFVGSVTDETRDELIGRASCFLLPSRGEGFGLVYLEAMRLGRPCLVSTEDAGREVVAPPEAGLAVDPSDQGAIAAAICRLLTRGEEWDTWSARARSRYSHCFTGVHFQRRLLSAIDALKSDTVSRPRHCDV